MLDLIHTPLLSNVARHPPRGGAAPAGPRRLQRRELGVERRVHVVVARLEPADQLRRGGAQLVQQALRGLVLRLRGLRNIDGSFLK